ncbi:20865_t:CDS:2 [Gigaspora rosea]|nr:20865_t:CDS:2 [Gigaspora rosea]
MGIPVSGRKGLDLVLITEHVIDSDHFILFHLDNHIDYTFLEF